MEGQQREPRVLIIKGGGCLNLATPRWNPGSFAGGPLYAIGGRSTVWGLYTPKINDDQLKYFPESVREYLKNGGYDVSLLTPHPHAKAFPILESEGERHNKIISHLNQILNKVLNSDRQSPFGLCPIAAEFTVRSPVSRLYQIIQGGYSTIPWILEQVFNNSKSLSLLSRTRVMTVNQSNRVEMDGRKTKIESLTVIDRHGKESAFSIGNAIVILSAGTVDTAAIALRSRVGEDKKSLVGRGLTDHGIWGTRFMFQASNGVESLMGQALRLQATLKLRAD
ncbi:hypothetical protein ANO14919_121650 [Xylariales sp. No.14919]|nr:hypothetical protein ANO14919_121650 [Xylariales sp. No.14919]